MVSDTNVPTVGIRQDNVSLFEGGTNMDFGSVLINEQSFSWDGRVHKFSIPYHQITLHAVAKHPDVSETNGSAFPYPHLFLMIDGDRPWRPSENGNNTDDRAITDDEEMKEAEDETAEPEEDECDGSEGRASDCPGETTVLRFVPNDPNVLDSMYSVLSECQSLNPDVSDDEYPVFGDTGEFDEQEEEECDDNSAESDQFADN